MRNATVLTLAITTIGCAAGAVEPPAAARRLSIEQLIDIKHPSDPIWSPDGRSVVFTWDRAGAYHVFDIVWLDNRDLSDFPLEERRELLRQLPECRRLQIDRERTIIAETAARPVFDRLDQRLLLLRQAVEGERGQARGGHSRRWFRARAG